MRQQLLQLGADIGHIEHGVRVAVEIAVVVPRVDYLWVKKAQPDSGVEHVRSYCALVAVMREAEHRHALINVFHSAGEVASTHADSDGRVRKNLGFWELLTYKEDFTALACVFLVSGWHIDDGFDL